LRRRGAVARNHYHPRDARIAQQPNRSWRIGPQFVGQQQRADRISIDSNKDDQRRAPGSAADSPHLPV
jgi:hypothetical protein